MPQVFGFTTLARIAFIAVLLIASVYFVIMNQQPRTTTSRMESFLEDSAPVPETSVVVPSPQKNAVVVKDITTIFLQLNKSEPSHAELEFWSSYIQTHDVTFDQLYDIISYSAHTVDSFATVYGTEDTVILQYNNILQRNPNKTELAQYASMLQNGDDSVTKLRQILMGSSEYLRMEKTQQNRAYSYLPGDITDRQLTMAVTSVYNKVATNSIHVVPVLDEDTLKFLKKKLVDFGLDTDRLEALIRSFVINPSSSPSPRSSSTAGTLMQGVSNDPNVQKIVKLLQTDNDVHASYSPANTTGTIDRPNKDVDPPAPPTIVIPPNQNNSTNVPTRLVTPSNRNAIDPPNQNSGNASSCKCGDNGETLSLRKTDYLNADKNMTIYPEFKWSIPIAANDARHQCVANYQPLMTQTALIGTLLEESADTKIGSILPFNPY